MCFKLSPSSLNLFCECEKCFWLKVKKNIYRPGGKFPSLPSGIDRVVKQHFDVFRLKSRTPPELEDTCFELVYDQDLIDSLRDWNSGPRWEDPETGAVLRGALDELLRNSKGGYVVTDFKTKGSHPGSRVHDAYRRQLGFYGLILGESGFDIYSRGQLIYYFPNTVMKNGDFVFNTEFRSIELDFERCRQVFRNAVATLEGDCPSHSEDCDFSDWKPLEEE